MKYAVMKNFFKNLINFLQRKNNHTIETVLLQKQVAKGVTLS